MAPQQVHQESGSARRRSRVTLAAGQVLAHDLESEVVEAGVRGEVG